MQLPLIPQDKANHFFYGAMIGLVVSTGVVLFSPHVWHPTKIGAAAAILAGLLKELADAILNYRATGDWRTGPHGVEANDFLMTAFGGLTIHFGAALAS